MRYLLEHCWIGLLLSTLPVFEQGRRYVLSDRGQDVATARKNHAADPLEGLRPMAVVTYYFALA